MTAPGHRIYRPPVTQVDDRRLSVGTAFISMLKDCYESVPWEEV